MKKSMFATALLLSLVTTAAPHEQAGLERAQQFLCRNADHLVLGLGGLAAASLLARSKKARKLAVSAANKVVSNAHKAGSLTAPYARSLVKNNYFLATVGLGTVGALGYAYRRQLRNTATGMAEASWSAVENKIDVLAYRAGQNLAKGLLEQMKAPETHAVLAHSADQVVQQSRYGRMLRWSGVTTVCGAIAGFAIRFWPTVAVSTATVAAAVVNGTATV